MRTIHNAERKQRACHLCADAVMVNRKNSDLKHRMCPRRECPYHELDGFEKYSDYLKSIGGDTLAAIMKNLGLGAL